MRRYAFAGTPTSARRSTLPLPVRGSASQNAIFLGIM